MLFGVRFFHNLNLLTWAIADHLQGIAALLRYEEYYVKESAIQILCALGVDTLLLFVDDVLRYEASLVTSLQTC